MRQPCVNGDWLCQWEMAIFDPHRLHTPWPITKKFVASDYVGDPYGYAKFGANPSTGGFWANGWNITKFFLFIPFFSWTHLQVRRDDGFSCLMAQTTRIHARTCLLGVSLTLLPILGVKYPKNPNFWGVNRRFQAKRANYWKFHRNYCIDFNEILQNDRDHQELDVGGPNRRPTYPRCLTAAILKKTITSLYLCNCLTDFDKIWYSDAYWPLTANLSLKFRIFENPKWRRPPSCKITKIAISP